MKKILIYGYNGIEAAVFLGFLTSSTESMGIEVEIVSQKDYSLPIGALANDLRLPISENVDHEIGEMLVFVNLESDELDQIMRIGKTNPQYKKALKAVMTPTNASWNAVALYRELQKEHEEMKKRFQNS